MAVKHEVRLEYGNDLWKQWRELATVSVPGRRSALYFLNEKIRGMKDLVPMTERAHYPMCMFAEGATGIEDIDRARVKLILYPRGCGKSSLITAGLPLLQMLRDQDRATGIANEKLENAKAFLESVSHEVEANDLIRVLFPEVVADQPWRSDRASIKRSRPNPVSPSLLAAGVDVTVTGVHMDEWIADDLVSQDAAEQAYRGSFLEIEKTNRWIGRLGPLTKNPGLDPICFIGTCWWEGDTYDWLQENFSLGEERRYHEWILRLPSGGTVTLPVWRAGEIAVLRRPIYENGTSFFPERLPDHLLEIERQRDPIFFAGQYLLEPTAGGGSDFDLSWLKTYEWEGPHAVSYRNEEGRTEHTLVRDMLICVSCDPAFSDKSTAARTAIPAVGVAGHNKFLLEGYAQRGLTVDGIAHKVLDYMVRYRPAKIIIETLVAQIAVADAVRRLARDRGLPEPPIEEIRSHGRQGKNMRIYGLEPYFKRGEFFYHKSQHSFVQEYTSFPRGQLRDILDALAMQRDYWERAALTTDRKHGPGGTVEAANRHTLSRIRSRR